MSTNGNLLEVRDLAVQFKTDEGIVRAVNGIAYELKAGGSLRHRGRVRQRQERELAGGAAADPPNPRVKSPAAR